MTPSTLKKLKEIERGSDTRPEIAQELDYLTAYCTSQMALGGSESVANRGQPRDRPRTGCELASWSVAAAS